MCCLVATLSFVRYSHFTEKVHCHIVEAHCYACTQLTKDLLYEAETCLNQVVIDSATYVLKVSSPSSSIVFGHSGGSTKELETLALAVVD